MEVEYDARFSIVHKFGIIEWDGSELTWRISFFNDGVITNLSDEDILSIKVIGNYYEHREKFDELTKHKDLTELKYMIDLLSIEIDGTLQERVDLLQEVVTHASGIIGNLIEQIEIEKT